MEFNKDTIRRFLINAIPSRFQYLSPDEFSSFIGFVFTTDGYAVEEAAPTADGSKHLLARKEDQTLVIRPLRYPREHIVNVDEIQKAASARTFYQTEQAWVITTSGFSDAAKREAEKLDVEFWDWDAFYQALTQLFFDGKSHLEFINEPIYGVEISDPGIRLKVNWQPEEGIGAEWYNLGMVITNNSDRNIYIHLDLPALIDTKKNQIMAEQWSENEFIAGLIYSGASVRTNALFNASKLGESPPGGKIMLTCHERTEPPSTYHLSARIKGSACYFVTYCHSRSSEEYRLMIRYRDEFLSRSFAGRSFIYMYYKLSPYLVRIAPYFYALDMIIRMCTNKAIQIVKKKIQ